MYIYYTIYVTPGLLTNLQAIDKRIFQATRTGQSILSLKGLQGSSLMLSVLCRGSTNGHLQCIHIGRLCLQSWNFPLFICSVIVVLIAANKIQQEKTKTKHPFSCLYLYYLSSAKNLMGCLFKYQHMGIRTQMCRYADAYAKQNFFLSLYQNSYKFMPCEMKQTFLWTVQHKLSIQVSLKAQSERLNCIKCCRSLMPHLCEGSGQSSFTVK